MAKTYLNTAKYVIHATFEINGMVENPDIVGAVFGQSEGLLGDEMDLKELQKSGKLGRIEITPRNVLGKTVGDLIAPSSMDIAETSVLAAAIESVDKVGPYDAKFTVTNLEDLRTEKRAAIKDRAKELLQKYMVEQAPDKGEITTEIREATRAAEIEEIGSDKLPCGPEIYGPEIIIVEGRADVINLLKNGIKNVIGIGGANVSPTIADIARGKKVTAFLDGDRGGELILRKLNDIVQVDFVARAPDGKEVEELTRKEIIAALRKPTDAADMPERDFAPREREFSPRGRGYSERPSRGGFRGRDERRGSRGLRSRRNDSEGSFSRGPRSRSDDSESGFSRGPRRLSGFGSRSSEGGFSRGSRGGSRFGSRGSDRGAPRGRPMGRGGPRGRHSSDGEEFSRQAYLSPQDRETFSPIMSEIQGSLKARLYDANMQIVKETGVRDLVKEISENPGVKTVVFDGVITSRLVEAAEIAGVEKIVGQRTGKIEGRHSVRTIALSQ